MKRAIQICYNEMFAERCVVAAAAGFDGVAVDFDINVTRGMDFVRAAEDIRAILEKNRLCCVQTHLPFYDLRKTVEEVDEDVEMRVRSALRASAAIGAPYAVLHPRTSLRTGFDRKASFAVNRERILGYLETAHACGASIALENMPIFPSIYPVMPFYTSDYRDLCELCDSFSDEYVKICWDFGHANLMAFDHADALGFVGERLACVHLHNNFAHDDNHFSPELGTIDWERVMPVLAKIGYHGPLTLEMRFYNKAPRVLASTFVHAKAVLEHLYACMIGV